MSITCSEAYSPTCIEEELCHIGMGVPIVQSDMPTGNISKDKLFMLGPIVSSSLIEPLLKNIIPLSFERI